jgi:hypothetical protein
VSDTERKLLDLFRALDAADRATLLSFAEFLRSRGGRQAVPAPPPPREIPAPRDIPRPAEESVVKAVKRLSETYPMLDKSRILGETSDLVAQHIVQGRDAKEVIDELERVFRRFYDELAGAGK